MRNLKDGDIINSPDFGTQCLVIENRPKNEEVLVLEMDTNIWDDIFFRYIPYKIKTTPLTNDSYIF